MKGTFLFLFQVKPEITNSLTYDDVSSSISDKSLPKRTQVSYVTMKSKHLSSI